MQKSNGMSERFAHIGATTVGKTCYQVYIVPKGPNACRVLPEQRNYALEGPNGAIYYCFDHGKGYSVGSVSMGGSKAHAWVVAPRPLRGLLREHLAAFYDNPAHAVVV